eukprot:9473338-Pyramimonas_sp.AAC.1
MEVMHGNDERSACCRLSRAIFHLPEASPKPRRKMRALVESAEFSNGSPRPSVYSSAWQMSREAPSKSLTGKSDH